MNENEIASKITAYLDKGAAGLKSGTLYRLHVEKLVQITGDSDHGDTCR